MSRPFPPPLAGKRATVMGLGLFGGGVAAVRWLVAEGARVTVTDLRDADLLAPAIAELEGLPVTWSLGEHRPSDFEDVALVVASPAVAPGNAWLERARAGGARITSEVEIFLATTRARLALITGTHGKSSTTTILAQLLERAGIPARAGGNIGTPLLGCAPSEDEVCVVELSSYQLEAFQRVDAPLERAEVAALTALAPDHLQRHGTFEAYAAAKARIGELCAHLWLPAGLDVAAFEPWSDPARRFGPDAPLRIEEGEFRLEGERLGFCRDLALPGGFQRENTLLALGLARSLGASPTALAAALPHLCGLPHRLEELGTFHGRRVIDNGVSTTPESTLSALASIDGPCTVLLGGQAKRGLDYRSLARALEGRTVVTFGASGAQLAELLGGEIEVQDDLVAATARALELTPEGATLLFSPACASFDAYPNFRARAQAFRAALKP